MVAHALELVGHVVEGQQVAQVAGDRLLRRDRDADHARDLALGIVDPNVALDDVQRELGVVVDQRLRGAPDGLLDERPHAQDGVLDLLLLDVERVTSRRLVAGQLGPALLEQSLDLLVDGGRFRSVSLFGHLIQPYPNRPDT